MGKWKLDRVNGDSYWDCNSGPDLWLCLKIFIARCQWKPRLLQSYEGCGSYAPKVKTVFLGKLLLHCCRFPRHICIPSTPVIVKAEGGNTEAGESLELWFCVIVLLTDIRSGILGALHSRGRLESVGPLRPWVKSCVWMACPSCVLSIHKRPCCLPKNKDLVSNRTVRFHGTNMGEH